MVRAPQPPHHEAFRLMDAGCLGFADATFDAVLSAFSIHLMPEPALGVAEAVRVLRPGGRFGVLFGGRSGSPRWDFYTELLARFARLGEGEPRLPPVVSLGDPCFVLEEAGLVEVEVGECEVHLPVPDSETFLGGELSHGYRSLFDALSPARRRQLEEEMLEDLEAMRRDRGIVLDRVTTCAQGVKPRR